METGRYPLVETYQTCTNFKFKIVYYHLNNFTQCYMFCTVIFLVTNVNTDP